MAGYGQVARKAGGKVFVRYAHRIAYEREYGVIPEGLHVCHRCDNPGCVRPEHLFLGTDKDNVRDCMSKGRNSKPPRNGFKPPRYVGEQHPSAKLSNADVDFIRKHYVKGVPAYPGNAADLAKQFGVSIWHVRGICNRKYRTKEQT